MSEIEVGLEDYDGDDQGAVTVFPPDEDGDIQLDFGAVHLNATPGCLRKLAIAILQMTETDE